MNSRRCLAVAASAAVLVGTGLGMSSPASASDGGQHWHTPPVHRMAIAHAAGAQPDVTAPSSVIAVRGVNNHLYSKYSSRSSFTDLGGTLVATPAVGYSSTTHQAYYVAVGSDHALYVRSDSTGFTKLVASACLHEPSVAVNGSVFTVACVGTSGGVYAGTTTLPARGNPVLGSLQAQGGQAAGAPTVFYVYGDAFLAVLGEAGSTGNVYFRAVADPAGEYSSLGEVCGAQVGFQVEAAYKQSYFGCQNGDLAAGSINALYLETFSRYDYVGTMSGTVGIAAAKDGSVARYYVSGTNGTVYSLTTTQTVDSPFSTVGGKVQPGVSAALVG